MEEIAAQVEDALTDARVPRYVKQLIQDLYAQLNNQQSAAWVDPGPAFQKLPPQFTAGVSQARLGAMGQRRPNLSTLPSIPMRRPGFMFDAPAAAPTVRTLHQMNPATQAAFLLGNSTPSNNQGGSYIDPRAMQNLAVPPLRSPAPTNIMSGNRGLGQPMLDPSAQEINQSTRPMSTYLSSHQVLTSDQQVGSAQLAAMQSSKQQSSMMLDNNQNVGMKPSSMQILEAPESAASAAAHPKRPSRDVVFTLVIDAVGAETFREVDVVAISPSDHRVLLASRIINFSEIQELRKLADITGYQDMIKMPFGQKISGEGCFSALVPDDDVCLGRICRRLAAIAQSDISRLQQVFIAKFVLGSKIRWQGPTPNTASRIVYVFLNEGQDGVLSLPDVGVKIRAQKGTAICLTKDVKGLEKTTGGIFPDGYKQVLIAVF